MSDYGDIINAEFGTPAERLEQQYLSAMQWLMHLRDCLHDDDTETRETAREILTGLAHFVDHMLRGECAA
jgi:hypothetical protein